MAKMVPEASLAHQIGDKHETKLSTALKYSFFCRLSPQERNFGYLLTSYPSHNAGDTWKHVAALPFWEPSLARTNFWLNAGKKRGILNCPITHIGFPSLVCGPWEKT